MSTDAYLEQKFPIQCRGRDALGQEVLLEPVLVLVLVHQHHGDESSIHLNVTCPHNTGGHGQRCKASHPGVDKIGTGVLCPFAVDIPYAFDHKQ